MAAPLGRELARGNPFLRQWRILVLLRRSRRTLEELAAEAGCSTRTTRRDLEVLQAAGLPIYTERGEELGALLYWRVHPFSQWPAGELTPVEELAV